MTRVTALVLAAATLLGGGCSMVRGHRAEFKPVSEADYGRLKAGQLGPVDGARAAAAAARDEVARAKLRLQQAEDEIALARADQTAARAATQRADAQVSAANDSNDPTAKAQAQEASAEAVLHSRSAQAHMAYAQRLTEARQAEVDAAEQLVKVRDAQLEKSRLTALTEAGLPAASKYNAASFDARVSGEQQRYSQRRADADQRMHVAMQNENAWRTLHAQYQARVQGPAGKLVGGTGTAAPQQPPPAPAQPATPSDP